jgi:plasmid stabilization system protein ParE
MKYHLKLLPEADENVDRIYLWIAKRSPEGARRWFLRFLEVVESLCEKPQLHGFAPENDFVEPEIRQVVFKTKRGLPYRALFRIVGGEIQILHVRGPGQNLLKRSDLPKE